MIRFTFCLGLVCVLGACRPEAGTEAPPSAEEVFGSALRVEVERQGRFQFGMRGWNLHLEPDGRAALFLRHGIAAGGQGALEPEIRTLEVSFEDLERLRAALVDERFFELPARLGNPVSDDYPVLVEVHVGDRSHSVELFFLGPEHFGKPGSYGTLGEAQRACRVLDELVRHLPADAATAPTPTFREREDEESR